jgi:hypothetical protein
MRINENLRFAALAGLGVSRYDFDLVDGGLTLEGRMEGLRRIYGATLSGDIDLGVIKLTTDASLSRAEEDLENATLSGRYGSETKNNIPFHVGRVDATRFSLPIRAPFILTQATSSREATRLVISPGLLCQDIDSETTRLTCGYQLGGRLTGAISDRDRAYLDFRYENVDGVERQMLAVGFRHRLRTVVPLEVSLGLEQQLAGGAPDGRVMMRLNLLGE